LKKYLQHLGLGNKNSEEILALFVDIQTFMDVNGYFPCLIMQLTENKGVSTKIASLALYFAYGKNDAISVDSHVVKCTISLKWVLE